MSSVAGTEISFAPGGKEAMHPSIVLVCLPVIFVGELPDKTMFASLVMATKGRPFHVWLGAAAAFLVHVVIAVTIGVALFAVLPHRGVDAVVALLFLGGAAYAWREGSKDEDGLAERDASRHGVVITAFIVIFLAEWGDLTQILTANLAVQYHSALSVGLGAVLALWAVAGLAVASGTTLLRFVNIRTVRKITAAVLVALALYTGWMAISA
jgi:putative Ca2+/H+ antiporter (TMEM165/GDT1 family)